MNSNHPALISGGLFFVIGLALAAALFTGLLPHCWHNGPSVCYWMTRAAGGAWSLDRPVRDSAWLSGSS